MGYLKNIRQALGLTYREMAGYLHTPLSVYSMAENSLRELPAQPSLQFTLLEMGLYAETVTGYQSVKDDHRNDQQQLLIEWCKGTIKDIELQLFRLRRQLERINEKSIQADKLLQAICHREQAVVGLMTNNSETNNGDDLQYAYLKQLSLQRLSAYGMLTQAKISLRIRMLERELVEVKELMLVNAGG